MPQSTGQPNKAVSKSKGRSKARFNRPSKDAIKQIRKKHVDATVDSDSHFSEKVRLLRKRVWREWEEYTQELEIDSQHSWKQLCESCPGIYREFKAFLAYYIECSHKTVVSLGPEESEQERTVNSASTIQDVWSALVSVANSKVLNDLRIQFPNQEMVYTLRYTTRGGYDAGPAGQVGRLIPELANEYGLCRAQLFEKTEMTLDDLLMILKTVWARASRITCAPPKRLAFSGVVILGGIGGWRFESLRQLKYKDIQISWVSHPDDPQPRCVAKIRIHHVKWKANKIERDQTSSFTFCITVVPFKPVCLLSHIVAMAFFRNAFSVDFATPEKILYPELDPNRTVGFIPLAWKDQMLEEDVFGITYTAYWTLWQRVLLVGGLRTKLKPYSVRVGAGNRLDGKLTPAIRSYVFGNTDSVFRRSYIPVDLPHDLMGIAYGSVAGENQDTISFLHHAFTKRDECAPVYISKEEFKSFEDRDDIQEWRRQRAALPDLQSEEAKRILSKIQYTKNVLEEKLLQKKRKEYFEQVDVLRSTGQAVLHLQESLSDPRFKQHQLSSESAEQLAPYFIAKEGSYDIASKLVRYLRQTSIEDSVVVPDPGKASSTRSTCFICFKDYNSRAGLTVHVRKSHSEAFEKPLYCLECKHKGQEVLVPAGLAAWSNHTERFHGTKHSPRPPTEADRSAHCLLCKQFLSIKGFNLHLRKKHEHQDAFKNEFACPDCLSQSLEFRIKDKNHWILHVKQDHKGGHIPGAVIPQQLQSNGRRARKSNTKRKLELEEDLVCKRLKTDVTDNTLNDLGRDPRFYDCFEVSD